MKGFARSVPEMMARSHDASGGDALLESVADGQHGRFAAELANRDELQLLMSRLERRERDVIDAHYGLSAGKPATYEQVGSRMGLSKQRVRQIEQSALAKMRLGARG